MPKYDCIFIKTVVVQYILRLLWNAWIISVWEIENCGFDSEFFCFLFEVFEEIMFF